MDDFSSGSDSSSEEGEKPNLLLMSGHWEPPGEEEGDERKLEVQRQAPYHEFQERREKGRRKGEANFYALKRTVPVIQNDEGERTHPKELESMSKSRNKRHRHMRRAAMKASKECSAWLVSDNEWTPVPFDKHPAVHLFEMRTEDGCHLLKARGPVQQWGAFDFARTQMDTNSITRLVWDTDLEDIKIVETIDQSAELQHVPLTNGAELMPGKLSVIWYRVKTPTVAKLVNVWDRDFCCLQYWSCKKDGSIHIVSKSVEHPNYPTEKAAENSCVRGETTCTMLIKKLDNPKGDAEAPTIFVEMAAWVKPNGWVPEKVIAWFKQRMADRILFFSKECFDKAKTKGTGSF